MCIRDRQSTWGQKNKGKKEMGDFWQKTAELYTALIERPKMSEKLLIKPPFKYLFDIVMETTKVTGFAKGLYSAEELDANFYSAKEQKGLFLKKIIDLVAAATKEEIEVKPKMILAGVEADKTNILLQAMHKAATSKTDYTPIVRKIVAKYNAELEAIKSGGQLPPEEERKEAPPSAKRREEPPAQAPREEAKRKQAEEPPAKAQPQAQAKPQPKARAEPEEHPKEKEAPKAAEPPANLAPPDPMGQTRSGGFRPASATKRPPKIKSNVIVEESGGKRGAAATNVIMDKKDDQDNDEMIEKNPAKMEEGLRYENTDRQKPQAAQQDESNQEAGSKIKMGKIGRAAVKKQPAGQETGATASAVDQKPTSGVNDMEFLKGVIQSLTQSVHPLGRSLDFITDDIESMNKELDYWRKQYLDYKARLQTELKLSLIHI
eukprot:TRINITY_DN1027_c0_g1_i2.p1 TRINITY_DN1027_c0_g1~~TRINITY_DN1027_c0_g1_i2.p1  ORF type:complete len:453 (+),score=152.43 TRINITY_DN1027_c0_g1_i2:62-1360(+)